MRHFFTFANSILEHAKRPPATIGRILDPHRIPHRCRFHHWSWPSTASATGWRGVTASLSDLAIWGKGY